MGMLRLSACFCLALPLLAAAARAGEEHMPLVADGKPPLRVNVVKIVLPSPAVTFSAVDHAADIPGVITPELALRDKRDREAGAMPKPFATRPDRDKSRPSGKRLPPPIESEAGFDFPGFGGLSE